MKLKKLLTLSAPLAIMLSATPVVLTSCNNNKTPTVYSAVKKSVPLYQYVTDPLMGSAYYTATGSSQNVTLFNDSPIPYIDLDEVFSSLEFCAKTAHGKTIITNAYNPEWVEINYANQTITFSDWDKFTDYNAFSYGPMTNGCNWGLGGTNKYLNSVKSIKYYAGKNQTIDLNYYGLKAFIYAEPYSGSEAHGYIPYHLVRNLLNLNIAGGFDYNGMGFFEIAPNNYKTSLALMEIVRDYATCYNSEYMEYCYNLLAMTLDLRYGLLERQSRVDPNKTIKYMPNGAYAMLAPYHNRLVSLEPDVSSDALREVFTAELDDGGHARYIHLNAFSTKLYETGAEQGAETKHTFEVFNKMDTARNKTDIMEERTSESGQKYFAIKEPYREYTNQAGDKTIAYITFDGFESQSKLETDEEKTANRELPSGTTEQNYMNDTLRLTMYANEKIQADRKSANPKINDVVIDISNNGGGAVYTEHFIASWLCGGVTEKIYNPTTGGYAEYEVKADINGDGAYDENDTIKDLNLYVITSSGSFSCGNMLPCNIADSQLQRGGKTILMGTKSGGGACFVDDGLFVGPQTYTRSSSTSHMLRASSLYNKYNTVDTGAEITANWEIDDWNNPDDFYKRDVINGWIWNGK